MSDAICHHCGVPLRATARRHARFCSPAHRRAAHRARYGDTRRARARFLTGRALDKTAAPYVGIVPDEKWPGMYRLKRADGTLSDMVNLTRAMALEFGPESVRVNAVLPGAVDTPMLHAGLSRGHLQGDSITKLLRGLGKKHVMGRVGKPHEIGQTIRFLAGPERSSFMTGQALIVDGGATARLSTE